MLLKNTEVCMDILEIYVCVAIIFLFVVFICELILYDESKIKRIDIIWVVSVSLFWPIYAIKYRSKWLVAVLNRLVYDIIHW